MSLLGAVNPSNNAFGGGAKYNLSNPVAASGGFYGGNNTVPNPIAGVQGANVSFARQNRGSNVRVPYARLVPHSNPQLALTASKTLTNAPYQPQVQGDPNTAELESSSLAAGRIAFIRGSRSGTPDLKYYQVRLNDTDDVNMFYSDRSNTIIGRQPALSTNRTQRLCSIEYLARLYAVVFRRIHIQLNTGYADPDLGGPQLKNYQGAHAGMLADYPEITPPFLNGEAEWPGTATLANTTDLAFNLAQRNRELANNPSDFRHHKQGIFAMDLHPFLRGKCLESGMVNVGSFGDKKVATRVGRALGDQFAFSALESRMAKLGLTDWRPDGVVLSKDHAGPDEESDHDYDSRLGQLFNVVIQGPAVCTNFVGDFHMAPMVGDRVFVLVVADVHFRKPKITDLETALLEATYQSISPQQQIAAAAERNKQLDEFNFNDWKTAADANFKGENDDSLLTNFRIRVSTSAEMLNYSGVDPTDAKNNNKIPKEARMGMRLGTTMGEYIVGGWSMGTVIDSAASRAALPGMNSIKSSPSSHALNISVNVEWWSGDRLYRNYCDVEKSIRGRHILAEKNEYKLEWSDKASMRQNDDFK